MCGVRKYYGLIFLLLFITSLTACGAGKKSAERDIDIIKEKGVGLPEKGDALSLLGIVPPSIEIEAYDFTVESLSGKKESLKDHRGKVVFLNFWATWCGPCRMEIGEIDVLHNLLEDEDFTVMALSIRENKEKVANFIKIYDVDFPVYLDADGTVATQYGVSGIPTTYIIAPDGMIVGRAVGPREWGSRESIDFMRSLMVD